MLASTHYVPESCDVFSSLSLAQNLWLGQKAGRCVGCWTLADVYRLFPQRKDRRALMGHGRMVFSGSPVELRADPNLNREWLAV